MEEKRVEKEIMEEWRKWREEEKWRKKEDDRSGGEGEWTK